MLLRPYQHAAVEAAYSYLRTHDGNPCIVIPTAGGKTPIIATICRDATTTWNGRVLVLAHVKELLEQAARNLQACGVKAGIYSAGLKRRDLAAPVVAAGIQSIYRRACDLGPVDLVLVDEAHLIPPGDDGDGMYRTFLTDAAIVNPNVRVIGLTATPFRMKSGMICGPDNFLHEICYEVGVRELIRDAYLCPPLSRASQAKVDTSRLHVRAGEFAEDEVEALMDVEEHVIDACAEIVSLTADRRSVLIFASGVKHGQHIQEVLRRVHGVECGFVCGETSSFERADLLSRFKGEPSRDMFAKREPLKYLCNVNVLTTGFDAPNIDCVVLLRPTLSPGLYYQMIGRGFRLHPSKQDFLVLDFGGNILRHGPVDQIRIQPARAGQGGGEAPAKECPECQKVVAAGYARCPDCNYEFPPPERTKHGTAASGESVVSGVVTQTTSEVQGVTYSIHKSRNNPDGPPTMRVDYQIGYNEFQSEWISFESTNAWARTKAEEWWTKRSPDPVPDTVDEAVSWANEGAVCETLQITVTSVSGQKFDRITDYVLGEMPEPLEPGARADAASWEDSNHTWVDSISDDDIPF